MSRPVVRWQIISTDPEATARFHQKLFGWERTAANALGYRELRTGAVPTAPVDGGVWPAPPGASSFVQLFVEVEDVAACAARAVELGGKVVVPPSVLPDGDEMAVVQDPQGLPVGICTLKH